MLTFAVAIPAITLGGIAERAKICPHLNATATIVGFLYPLFEGVAWIKSLTSSEFHDFPGSIAVPAMGG